MAPSNAIESAGATSCRADSQSNAGSAGRGNCAGMPPNRLPIVSTGKSNATTARVPKTSAITLAGTLPTIGFPEVHRGHSMRISNEASATIIAQGLRLGRVSQMICICAKKFAGIRSIGRPIRSRTCWSAIRTAMPLVNPIMIETGTNRIRTPIRRAPIANKKPPAIMVAMSKLATPYRSTMP